VYLVGAGPGDPGLITVRGLECLRMADVVVYDRLASSDLLHEAKEGAILLSVGKETGHHPIPQPEINQKLVELARAGKTVVRLKGGDPFVFGRGGEEAEALVEAGIPFEVIPGVTSAVSVPAYAGIPVTHREGASSFAVITGHEDPRKPDTTIAWDKIATGVDTLVFLMGLSRLPLIVEQLLKHGRPADTPVAVVRWGTRPEQLTVMGRLADIVETVSRAKVQPPTVVVVGSVVRLREKLRWFDTKPLFGLRVLVTRSREQAGQLSALLARHGAYPIEFPVIATEPVADFTALDAALSRLAANDWVIFTSVNGVRAVVSRLRQRGQDVRAFGAARLCAIGPATAAEVERSGLRVDFVPKEYVAESIAAGIGDVVGKRILLPRSAIAREALAVDLRRRGALVEEVAAYRTTLPKGTRSEAIRARLAARELDMVAFTSSSTVRHFAELIRQRSVDIGGNGGSPTDGRSDLVSLLEGVTIACIGPVTAKTAEEFGLHVAIRAKEFTIPGLVDAIVKWREGSVADVSRER